MGWLIVFVFLVLVIIWLYKRSSRRKTKTRESRAFELAAPLSVKTAPTDSFDTGPVKPTQDGEWILNPKSTFPLTLYGGEQKSAKELKKLLDEGLGESIYSQSRAIVPLIIQSNLHCKEIDGYIKGIRPQYLKKIEELKQTSAEWATASPGDKEDLLLAFRKKSIESLDTRPYCENPYRDLTILFEWSPEDFTIDNALLDRFGFENVSFYLKHSDKLSKVHIVPADHYNRDSFEKIVEAGLARRGKDIPLQSIFETLRLKDLNKLIADIDQKPFGRRDKAIEFLMKLPDIQERTNKILAFREFFQLNPFPSDFSGIDSNELSRVWKYSTIIAFILAHTYSMADSAARNMRQNLEDISFIEGWKLEVCDDEQTCLYCKQTASKTYPKDKYPIVPKHIGCRCMVMPKLGDPF